MMRLLVFALALVLAPAAASACPACFAAATKEVPAYIASAVVMLALPILFVGGSFLALTRLDRPRRDPGSDPTER